MRHKFRNVDIPAYVVAVAAVIVFLLVSFCLYAFLVRRSTPFSVSTDTSSIEFSTAGDASDVVGSQVRGLIASDSNINLDVGGCSKFERTDVADSNPIRCLEDSLSTTNVQLSHLTLAANTRVTLSVLDHAVHMRISRPTSDNVFELRISSSDDSTGLPLDVRRPRAGEWRIVPSGPILTLVLADGKKSSLRIEEQEQKLMRDSDVRFRSNQGSALQGYGLLLLPQLPRDLEQLKLGKGTFSIEHLQSGVLRQLSLNREANGLRSLHVELTGYSDELLVYDTYSTEQQNQALTLFEANSGKDRRVNILTLGFIILGTLSVISTLYGMYNNYFQIEVNRTQILLNHQNTLARRGDHDLLRVAKALELSNRLRVGNRNQVTSLTPVLPQDSADEGTLSSRSEHKS